MIKKIRYILEAIITKFGFFLFTILGVKKSANLGAFLAKLVGTKIPVHKLAQKNISLALPNLSKQQIAKTLDSMWDNLGRVAAEFVHIAKCPIQDIEKKFVKIDATTKSNINYIKKNCRGGIIFSGHIGNWEVGPKLFLYHGIKVFTVYRPLNNPYVEEMTAKARGVDLIPKSAKGSKQIIQEIKNGNYVIILADQKTTDGKKINFFHDKAATTLSIAKIALKYKVPLIAARSIRIGTQSKFIVEVEKPIFAEENDDEISLTTKINQKLEQWIKEYPAQWFWVHNRWKK